MGSYYSRSESNSNSTGTEHQDGILSWAAERVARQREGQRRGEPSSSSSSTSRRSSVPNHYFSAISQLVSELLHNGQLELNVMNGGLDESDHGSEDDYEGGRPGLRGRSDMQPTLNEDRSDIELEGTASFNEYARTSACSPASRTTSDKQIKKGLDYLLSEIALHSGESSGSTNLPQTLAMREMGLRYANRQPTGKLSYAKYPTCASLYPFQRASISNRFFPNRRKVVEKLRTKTFCCQYMPDGYGLLTASQDEVIRLYRREGNRQRYKLSKAFAAPFVGWSILDMVVSPDSRHCVYSTWSERMYQCDLGMESGEEERWTILQQNSDYEYDRFALFSLRFNFDGTEIVGAGSDGKLYVYDRNASSNVLRIPAHEDDVNAVSFGDTSRHLIFSAGDDGLCKVWDRRALGDDHRPVGVFAGHRDGITYVDSKGDDRYLLTNSKDQSIKVWDIRRFSSTAAQDETRRAVCQQRWDYRYQSVPHYANWSQPLRGDGSVLTLRGHSVLHTLIRAHFSPPRAGQRYVYTGCARGQCVVYDLLTGEIVHILGGHHSVVRDCGWHPFDNELVVASWDGVTAMWRYDARVERNIRPDSWDESPGDEESSDEYYSVMQPNRFNVKRSTARRNNVQSQHTTNRR